ncbi:hypothetical protein ACF8O8_18385 [Pseudomonas sp. TYF_14]|uniref:hypothetical protein n=1 Tax=Pseudomonas sp. TYF_14 TaxID=3367193 RepID=UPI00370B818D
MFPTQETLERQHLSGYGRSFSQDYVHAYYAAARVRCPAIKEAGGKEEAKKYYEAKEEHRTVAPLVIPDLLQTETGSVEFDGRVKVMKELLEHHTEEEEGELFPTAKKLLGKDVLEQLGQTMEAQRKMLKGEQRAA